MSANSFAGTAMVLTWAGVAITGEYRRVTINGSVNDADGTSGTDTEIRHMPTQTDANFALELTGMAGTAGTAIWNSLQPRTQGTIVCQPEGTASNLRKYQAKCYVQNFAENIPYNDTVIWTVQLNPMEAVTRTFN